LPVPLLLLPWRRLKTPLPVQGPAWVGASPYQWRILGSAQDIQQRMSMCSWGGQRLAGPLLTLQCVTIGHWPKGKAAHLGSVEIRMMRGLPEPRGPLALCIPSPWPELSFPWKAAGRSHEPRGTSGRHRGRNALQLGAEPSDWSAGSRKSRSAPVPGQA
jgi:hypothetical protein